MENGFEKVEYGLRLLKKDTEKIDKEVNFVDKFSKYIVKEKNYSFKMKYILTYTFIFLLILNLFVTIEKLNLEKAKKSYIVNFTEKKDNLPETLNISLNKNNKCEKKENRITNLKSVKDENVSPIEESIKFTEEINKIIDLFSVNLNIGGKNVEI
ncbi:MAG: hypothetical protein NC833_05415 [Candidatus Omnitrophica bacterium]|nr:hypothetical protein [Candidatus Omnitrophota bacterium]